jgi:hypothetical protein
MPRTRRLVAVLCILAVVAGALLAPLAGGSTSGILVPLAPLFGFVVAAPAPRIEPAPAYAYVPTGPSPSRAPPAA